MRSESGLERRRVQQREYYARNRERIFAKRKLRDARDKEKRAAWAKEHRAKNGDALRARQRARWAALADQRKARRRANRALIDAAKSVPCAHCRQTFPPIAMDLHHLRDKRAIVGQMTGGSPELLRAEIAKCVALCANCHRIHHADEHYA